MITHSQPFVNSEQGKIIQDLLIQKKLQSSSFFQSVKDDFKAKFNQNLYFVSSGTHALFWVLKGLNISCGDEVILPTYVCSSVYKAIIATGAKPVLCDTAPCWHMSPEIVEKYLTKKTKAILIVNLFGMNLDCAKFRFPGIVLINDLCQSFDCLRNNNRDHGDLAIYSFGPTKFITAGYGGGFSVLNNNTAFLNYLSPEYLDCSVSNLNLALLKRQLLDYDSFILKRKLIANYYFSHIKEEYTKYIERDENSFYRFHLIQSSHEFTNICKFFQENEIAVRRGVDELIHRKIGLSDNSFPNSVNAYNRTVSLPIYPGLSLDSMEKIVSVFSEYFL